MRFTDNNGREYDCIVTVRTVGKLRRIGVNLNDLFKRDSDLISRLEDDVELMVNTLCLICEESIRKNLSGTDKEIEDQFAASLGGDEYAKATEAMWEAIASFFPPPQRAALMKVWNKSQDLTRVMMAQVETAAENLTTEILSKFAGNSQESREA